jgi:hypothetical protein
MLIPSRYLGVKSSAFDEVLDLVLYGLMDTIGIRVYVRL